jgi:hypothetical protein
MTLLTDAGLVRLASCPSFPAATTTITPNEAKRSTAELTVLLYLLPNDRFTTTGRFGETRLA